MPVSKVGCKVPPFLPKLGEEGPPSFRASQSGTENAEFRRRPFTIAPMNLSAFLDPLAIYLEAFAEHDPIRRGELLARSMTPDAEIWGPQRVFAGYADISVKIDGFHKNWPGCRLVLASGLNTFRNVARFAGAIVGPDGTALANGQSVIELAEDGRISRVLPFWEALPPIPESWPARLASPPGYSPNPSSR